MAAAREDHITEEEHTNSSLGLIDAQLGHSQILRNRLLIVPFREGITNIIKEEQILVDKDSDFQKRNDSPEDIALLRVQLESEEQKRQQYVASVEDNEEEDSRKIEDVGHIREDQEEHIEVEDPHPIVLEQ